ncbi:MAG TPA: hypothetical protein VGV64_04485 [Thermoplasmata archaeon]|nr:hypothetical protein [Thermoplasmata archaeon]
MQGIMGRTLRDYVVAGGGVAPFRERLCAWFEQNAFRILDENSDGTVRTYDAPEIGYGARTRGLGGHLKFATPIGSIVGLNVAAAGPNTPTVFAVTTTPDPAGLRVHGEFFSPIRLESLGGGRDLELVNTIWAPAGVQRKKAWVLLQDFERFVAESGAVFPMT